MTTAKAGRAPGHVFLAPKAGRGQDGPMIIDDRGDLVWFKPTPGKIPADFRVQTYQGKPVLTWWEGQLFVGDGDGVGQVYDTNYRPVTTVRTGNGYSFDLHEFTITPRDTAIVLAYERYRRDLRQWGGPRDSRIVDNIIQEIDLKTGAVLFEWHSFGNVSPAESNVPPPTAPGFEWEYFHVNSAEVAPDGNFVISARNTSAIYKINRATGKIMWRLGGKKSDFKLGAGVRFDWQHSARTQADGTLKLYDNSAAPPTRKASRVLTLRLDEQAKTASVVTARTHPRKLLSSSQGNVETLPNGNTFVGWGSQRWFTEFNSERRGRLRRPPRARQRQLPRVPLAVGRAADQRAEGRGDVRQRAHHGARELERRDRGRALAAAGRSGGRSADAGGRERPHGLRDRGHGHRHAGVRRDARVRRRGQRARHVPGGQAAGLGIGWRAANWPHAASMSRPRVSRTVARRPCSSSAARKASIALREEPS